MQTVFACDSQDLSSMSDMQLANRLTKELIVDLNIQEGHGLCYFLNVSPCYYNYLAVWRWVMAWVESDNAQALRTGSYDDVYDEIRADFIKQFPARSF